MRTAVFVALLAILSCASLEAQRKKPAGPQRPSGPPPKTAHFLGVAANYNGISGIEWEASMAGSKKKSLRSTYSVVAGFSSRIGDFKTDEQTGDKTSFVRGVGASIALNNYIDDLRSGIYWSVGVSGNYYFQSFVDEAITDDDVFIYPKYKNLKTFSVFGNAGYKWKIESNQHVKTHLLIGLMGSPFKSSSPADINGFFYGIGVGYAFKLN